jgi:putative MFS transporter
MPEQMRDPTTIRSAEAGPPLAPTAGSDRRNGPTPLHTAERLDRLPVSRWLVRLMLILFLGWLVESYDIGLIGNVLPSLSHIYHLSTSEKSFIATASTIGIVIGILPAGYLADRFGRRWVFFGGIVAYSVVTFVTGFVNSASAIAALRLVAGLGMGAVFPLPYMIGSEFLPAKLRGRFTGLADSFLSVGYFLSPLLAIFLIPNVSSDGWRTMFFLGGIPILFALLVWRWVPESPRWLETKGRHQEAEKVMARIESEVARTTGPLPPIGPTRPVAESPGHVPLRTLLNPTYIKRTIMLWIVFGGSFFIFYAIQLYMPTVIHKLGYTLTSAFVITSIIVGVSIPGKYFEAWVVERWGRKPVIISFTGIAAVAAILFAVLGGQVGGEGLLLVLASIMSFFGIAVDPAVKVYTTENYPTRVRATGTNATEGFGRLISGIIGPAVIPVLLASQGVEGAYVLVGAVALIAVAAIALLGTETKGQTLETISK